MTYNTSSRSTIRAHSFESSTLNIWLMHMLTAFVFLIAASFSMSAKAETAQTANPALNETYKKPTMAKALEDYYGYHDTIFFGGVTWATETSLSEHRHSVFAPMSGTVKTVSESPALGQYVVIEHAGELSTLLAGFNSIAVQEGALVFQDQNLGSVDPKEAQLYQEVTFAGVPLDPSSVIGFGVDSFQYFVVEALDEIERGPYSLISDMDFDQWQNAQKIAAAQTATPGDMDAYEFECEVGDIFPDGDHCCGDSFDNTYKVPRTCRCDVWAAMIDPVVERLDAERKIVQSHPFSEPPSSLLDMMCWDQLTKIDGDIGANIYVPPANLSAGLASFIGGAFLQAYNQTQFFRIVDESYGAVGKAWSRSFWADLDLNSIPGLVTYAYIKAQEFLDLAVMTINNFARNIVGGLLSSITGGLLNTAGLGGQFNCDTMYRLWNVAENCFDIDLPEFGDLLGRIELPGLACEIEAFAYGGSGMRGIYDLMGSTEVGGSEYRRFNIEKALTRILGADPTDSLQPQPSNPGSGWRLLETLGQ